MKKIALALIIVSSSLWTACSRNKPSAVIAAFTADTAYDQTWVVSSFTSKNEDRTPDFHNYTFRFVKPRNIIAEHNGLSENGIMFRFKENTGDRYDLVYTGIDPSLAKLTGEWTIVTNTNSELALKNSRNATQEEIHFTIGKRHHDENDK